MVFKSNKKVKSEHPKQSRNWGQTKSHKQKIDALFVQIDAH